MFKQVGNPIVAEELTQETFVRAFRGIKGFRFDARFSTWLTRIALNQSKSYFRSRRFKESSKNERYDEYSHDQISGADTEAALMEAESLRRLQRAILRLPTRYREVLVLCALEKKSYEEASQILGVAVGTIRSRLNRARHQLKDMYFAEAE